MGLRQTIEKVVFRVTAAVSGIVGILEILGAFQGFPKIETWVHEHAPVLCVIFFATLLGLFVEILERLNKINSLAAEQGMERLKRLKSELDNDLNLVVGSEMDELIHKITTTFESRSMRISDIEKFRSIYKKTLESYPRCHFFATSIPSARFFWKNDSIEQAMATFLEKGGTIERIFFTDGSDLDHESKRILRIQANLGVKIFLAPLQRIPEELRKFVMVEAQGRIGWEPVRDPTGEITAITISSNRTLTRRFLNVYNELKALDCITPYTDDGSAPDLNQNSLTNTYTMNMPIDVEAFKQFEHDGWEQSVPAYDNHFGHITRQMLSPLFDELKLEKNKMVLDVATGPGYAAQYAHKLGCTVSAIDISEAMVAKARQALPTDIKLSVGDAEHLPFAEAAFDAVVMNFGILHLAQPELAAREAYKALKVGGKFGFTAWAPPESSIGFSIVLRGIESHGSSAVKLPAGPPFFKYGVREQGIALLTSAGFSSPRAHLIQLTWRLPNEEALFEAFYEGTARTGGNLRAQPVENRDRIRKSILEHAAKYRKNDGIELPMAAWVYVGEKFTGKNRRSIQKSTGTPSESP